MPEEIVYDWATVGNGTPQMRIHKTTGRLYWNSPVHQYLGSPQSVLFQYDETNNAISLVAGFSYAVLLDENGYYYIESLSALEECGLEFPLDDNILFSPSKPDDSMNRVIMNL